MASNSRGTSNGMGVASVLTIVFVVLKLTHNIGWSWWWVLSPLWIVAALTVVLFVAFGLGFAIYRKRKVSK